MARATFTRLAQSDLRTIKSYIAQDNPDAAVKYLAILKRKCDRRILP
jgi:plasmid stabilization system protein ParE